MDIDDARSVASALRSYERQIDELLALLEGKRSLTPGERVEATARYRTLKDGLRAAAKAGTVDGLRRPLTACERAYFEPAVSTASANLTAAPAVNTNPITSHWHGALYGIRIDITHLLFQLEKTAQEPGT